MTNPKQSGECKTRTQRLVAQARSNLLQMQNADITCHTHWAPGNVDVNGNGMEQKKPNATPHAPASAPNRSQTLIASIPIFHKAGFSMSSNYFYLARATSVPSTSGRYVPRCDQHYPTEYLGSRSSLSIMTYTPNGKTRARYCQIIDTVRKNLPTA